MWGVLSRGGRPRYSARPFEPDWRLHRHVTSKVRSYGLSRRAQSLLSSSVMSFYRRHASEEDVQPAVEMSPFIAGSESDADEARRLRSAIGAHVAELLGEEDPEFVQDLVDTFCASAHELVATVRGAQDLAHVGKVAHQLKGSAANVGLNEIESAWYRVEAGARTDDPTVLGLALANAVEVTSRAADLLGAA